MNLIIIELKQLALVITCLGGDKLPESIFENFEIAEVNRKQFQNFQKSRGLFVAKITQTNHVITG